MSERQPERTTSHPEHIRGEKTFASPLFLSIVTLLAGPQATAFFTLPLLNRFNRGKKAKIGFILLGLLYPCLYLGLILWPIKWYWPSLTLLFIQILAAIIVYTYFRQLQQVRTNDYITTFPASRLQEHRYLFTGIIGGLMLMSILGFPVIIGSILGFDRLLISLMPVAFDDMNSLVLLLLGISGLGAAGTVTGGVLGKIGLRITPLQLIGYSLGLAWITISWFFFLQIVLLLPGFTASQIGDHQIVTPFVTFFIAFLLVGCWWLTLLLLHGLRGATLVDQFLRIAAAPAVCLCSAILFALACGYPTDWFHSIGKYLEKEGRIASSLWFYERGMSKNPSGYHASYLQFRIALLAHKLGERKKAAVGFSKVVSVYNDNSNLVTRAAQFLDNMKRHGNKSGKRVVLPGVESPTTYKGSYCVPNSLAMVMRYWGAEIDAGTIGRTITGLNSGTMTVDQAWYAHSRGFRHDFLPVASTQDIMASIDNGFPVMVYVPAHVFVIVGYDEVLDTFVTYDVATKDIWVDYLKKDFIKSWKKEDTTMVLVYPPEQYDRIPVEISSRLADSDISYLHYHLHYLDSPEGYTSVDHLLAATDGPSSFFLPLVTAYDDFPSMRGSLVVNNDVDKAITAISSYFGDDFDEGSHLAGQQNFTSYPSKDKRLEASLKFLIGTGHLDQADQLIETIQAEGIVSTQTQKTEAMLDLALGDFDSAITQLTELDDGQLHFYLAQSYLSQGNVTGAVTGLVKTIDNCT